VEIANGTTIYITDAFPTLDTWTKDGQEFKRKVWMILDFETDVNAADVPDSFSAAEDSIPF
jgi:hypothetical protein